MFTNQDTVSSTSVKDICKTIYVRISDIRMRKNDLRKRIVAIYFITTISFLELLLSDKKYKV